ncbi:MAG: M20/M25/M40 family metallo-hydrolase [Pirellulaceae bacterium]
MVDKIKQEGLERSQVMETISYLTDVHGPRLTGSPYAKKAANWTLEQLSGWGLENAHLESWGPFGRGWTLESCSVNMVEPVYSPIIAHVKAWSPSTTRSVRGVPIYLDAQTPEELEQYRGKLGRAIVLISPPRQLEALFDPPAKRKTEEDLLRLANANPPESREPGGRSESGRGGRGRGGAGDASRGGPDGGGSSNTSRSAPSGAESPTPTTPADESRATEVPPAAETKVSENPARETNETKESEPPEQPPQPPEKPTEKPTEAMQPLDPRAAARLQADKWQMAFDEGAAVVLEPGRGDGGNVFVASVVMPRNSSDQGEQGSRFSRGPRPWHADAGFAIPQAVLAAEHYNRLVRMLEKGIKPTLDVDIVCQFYDDDPNSFNIIAEIPGMDLKDEVVMLGAHFDSWQSGTGATDNAVGCGVAMEAIRILKAIDVAPRRTIRLALWTGEEQGLLGSRAYVEQHFGKRTFNQEGGRPLASTYELKPEQEKISAYYNLDNGTGRIRGIYMQGNEQLRTTFRKWLAPFTDMESSTISVANTGGTDHQSFDAIGIPGFQFIQDEVEYNTRTHHSSMDVFDRIQEDDVKQASIIMASFVYHTAMRDEKLPRKPLNGKIVMEGQATELEDAEEKIVETAAETE